MKTFDLIKFDLQTLQLELNEFEAFLANNPQLRERKHVLPFFKSHRQLCAAIGLLDGLGLPDRVATELDLFGDMACDAASGDSSSNSYTLIEFEDANEYSIFGNQTSGSVRRWSTRFERGFSQLVDWAWRLSLENHSSHRYRSIFGNNYASINFLLIIGRDADLNADDLQRLTWRARHTTLGAHKMSCMTFDNVLDTIRRRLLIAADPSFASVS